MGFLFPFLLSGLHCGGQTVGVGSGESGDSGTCRGSCPAADVSVCPADLTQRPQQGAACAWGGACTFQIDPCNTGATIPFTCDCVNGAVSCPPLSINCPASFCPQPPQVQQGASCVGALMCPSDHPVCPGGTSPEVCTCKAGQFECPVAPCPPPPLDCTLGAGCPNVGATCSTATTGPCGQYDSFTCDATLHWGSEVSSCTDGATCQMPNGPCGPVNCMCTSGTIVCSSQGCFDGGVAEAGGSGG